MELTKQLELLKQLCEIDGLSDPQKSVVLDVGDGQTNLVDVCIQQQVRTSLLRRHHLANQTLLDGAAAFTQIFTYFLGNCQCVVLSACDTVDLCQLSKHLYCLHKSTSFPVLHRPLRQTVFSSYLLFYHTFSFFSLIFVN